MRKVKSAIDFTPVRAYNTSIRFLGVNMSNQFEKYSNTFAKMIQCPTVSSSGAEYFDKFQQVLKEEFPLVFSNLDFYAWKCSIPAKIRTVSQEQSFSNGKASQTAVLWCLWHTKT